MYRSLNIDEIEQLQRQGCTAENWRSITVSDNFSTEFIRDVNFYGEVSIGNYEIGDDCYISNVGLLQNTGEAEVRTKTIAVLNEAGDGNIIA